MSIATKNQERLAGIIAEIVTALGIDVGDCNLGPGPDICALGDEAVAASKYRPSSTPSGRAEELITQLEAEIIKRDAQIAELSDAYAKELNMLAERNYQLRMKAQPSAGAVLPERQQWFDDYSDIRKAEIDGHNDCLDEVARLNPCRAQSVPAMARALADRCADACNVNRDDYWKQYGDDCIEDVRAMLAAASSTQQKESE